MQTNFTEAQLANPLVEESEKALRSCVHCGFCSSSCPTYNLLGDELDSPRGRIYLIKDMLEGDKAASETVATHLDRCLSCLSCQDICPSDVSYMHLIDAARLHIENTYKRKRGDRMLRAMLGYVMPRPGVFAGLMRLAALAKPFRALLPGRLTQMVAMAPKIESPLPARKNVLHAAAEPAKARVALLAGCVQQAVGNHINDATARLLNRHGVNVTILHEAQCCGAVNHHLGQEDAAFSKVRANITAWVAESEKVGGFDAIIANASGCGTMLKDYGHLLRNDALAQNAAQISVLTQDVAEYLATLPPLAVKLPVQHVTYQAACSLRHGQGIIDEPLNLLRAAGFEVSQPKDPHMCCGSAGAYNMLQPEIASQLGDNKAAAIAKTEPEIIVSSNLGCMTQLEAKTDVPIVHLVELLDWASGGDMPKSVQKG
jgi:glycolate oxidase iron-sulfur subunit